MISYKTKYLHKPKYFVVISILLVLIIQTNSQANIFSGYKFGKKSMPKYSLTECLPNSKDTYMQKLYNFNATLCNKLKLNRPTIYIFEFKNIISRYCNEYNAFAGYYKSNYKKPMVAIGGMLVGKWQAGWITDQEIEAILAHELSHVKCQHALKSGVLNLALNGPFLINRIFVPTPSPKELTKTAYSRKCEKEADLKAIKTIADPMALFTALVKLHCLNLMQKPKNKKDFTTKCETTINDLIRERKSFISPLIEILSTHPLTSTRMAYIKKQAKLKRATTH